MNKTRKKRSEKTKETENPLQTIQECSPGCAYMNMNKTKNVSPNRSGTTSPVRSTYIAGTKAESTIINKTATLSQKQISKSPDRNSLKNDEAKTKSPTRSNQKTRVSIYQSDKTQNKETAKSPDRLSVNIKRSIESVIAGEKRRSPDRYDTSGVDTSRPGRIRITGRLGLTEDDKCILKCDATLNDKPIPTQFQGANCAMLPLCYEACNEEFRSLRNQRDVKIQAKESPMRARSYALSATGKESQATQVDFQLIYSTATSRREDSSRGKVMQKCACVNTIDNTRSIYDNKEESGTTLKKNHSPLIVISVYSKNEEPSEKSGDTKPAQIKTKDHKKEIKKSGRSRSPSPAKNSKNIIEKKSDSRMNASTTKKTVRETARKVTRSKLNQTQSRSTVRTSTKTKSESRTTKSRSPKGQKTPPRGSRSNSPPKQEELNATEQMKRALIEDFTKTYSEHINKRNAHLEIPLQTKHNVSNITIDIEGDSEYYNVKLEQDSGKLNTQLTVRKPRSQGPRAGDNTMSTLGEPDTTSLENFLYMPENEHRKRSFSQTLMFDGIDQLTLGGEEDEGNALNVKDSIEVSHRRETKVSNDDYNEVDTKNLAQIKHFQGDDCPIPNPITRDREIQQLLGIDKGVGKHKPSHVIEKQQRQISAPQFAH
ncbi:serine/arginine repetitive matrix protein 2-like isoform X2 [Leguminivora glycinivorella]|uniref:serine/arginine repetitive matrix protein 2-like isoform X2 n=1 Tax=Leguminivora glycinivorella TaxID=1035111 RepID=UPI00200CA4DD|nr:serine/arginine repetitive matrix protein 2-like isoform X2 [Leguminivora glycinivorella]